MKDNKIKFKKDSWVLFFVGVLFLFFIASLHFLSPQYKSREGYNFDGIVRYLYDKADSMPYVGRDNIRSLDDYNNLKDSINNTIDEINDAYDEVKKDYRFNLYNFDEYYKIKVRYKNNIKNLNKAIKILEEKIQPN